MGTSTGPEVRDPASSSVPLSKLFNLSGLGNKGSRVDDRKFSSKKKLSSKGIKLQKKKSFLLTLAIY